MTITPTIGNAPVCVSDQNRALECYRDKLGFDIVMDMPMAQDVRWLVMAPVRGATEFILFHPSLAGADGQTEEWKRRVGTWTGSVLLTGDCRAYYKELVDRGVKCASEPKVLFEAVGSLNAPIPTATAFSS
jgi:Glyoxalase/Bleomycin resistance protein/Dioxygenase superfamily